MQTFTATYTSVRLNGKELKAGIYTIPAKPQKVEKENPLKGFKI